MTGIPKKKRAAPERRDPEGSAETSGWRQGPPLWPWPAPKCRCRVLSQAVRCLATPGARPHHIISVAVTNERENAAGDHSLAAVTQPTDWSSVEYRVFRGSRMTVLMAMSRAIRRGLQLLVLIGCQEREDLLVRGLVQFLRLGAMGRLRLC